MHLAWDIGLAESPLSTQSRDARFYSLNASHQALMITAGSSTSRFAAEGDALSSRAVMHNPLSSYQRGNGSGDNGASSSNVSALSTSSMPPSTPAPSDKGLLASTHDLADWLNFWKAKRESVCGNALDPFIHHRARTKHWTPDRGPGVLLHQSWGTLTHALLCCTETLKAVFAMSE